MFWNERLGEFAQEIKAMVELPLPIAELPLRVTAQDGGSGGGEAIQRDLLLPSKNLALQNALLGVLLERCDKIMHTVISAISLCSTVAKAVILLVSCGRFSCTYSSRRDPAGSPSMFRLSGQFVLAVHWSHEVLPVY